MDQPIPRANPRAPAGAQQVFSPQLVDVRPRQRVRLRIAGRARGRRHADELVERYRQRVVEHTVDVVVASLHEAAKVGFREFRHRPRPILERAQVGGTAQPFDLHARPEVRGVGEKLADAQAQALELELAHARRAELFFDLGIPVTAIAGRVQVNSWYRFDTYGTRSYHRALGMARRKTAPRQRHRNDHALDALEEIFLGEGVRRVSVGELARRLRCSRRTLYALAKSKQELFLLVVDRFLSRILRLGDESASARHDPAARIEAYLEPGIQQVARSTNLFFTDIA